VKNPLENTVRPTQRFRKLPPKDCQAYTAVSSLMFEERSVCLNCPDNYNFHYNARKKSNLLQTFVSLIFISCSSSIWKLHSIWDTINLLLEFEQQDQNGTFFSVNFQKGIFPALGIILPDLSCLIIASLARKQRLTSVRLALATIIEPRSYTFLSNTSKIKKKILHIYNNNRGREVLLIMINPVL
jgi:hypothetical protein